MTPDCIAAPDTFKVKSGGWPLAYSINMAIAYPCEFQTCHLFFTGQGDPTPGDTLIWKWRSGGKAFIYRDERFDQDYLGDYVLEVFNGVPFQHRCFSVPFRIVASVGNPWVLIPKPCANPGMPDCFPMIEIRFDPSHWCNTAACRKIRIMQAYRDSGVCGVSCFRILSNAEQGMDDGAARDQTSVNGWTIDAAGDDPETFTVNEEERDPYLNGNDARDTQFTGHRVGTQGVTPDIALIKDQPSTSLPGEPPGDVIEFVTTFETNAFCSDGPIQGEWLGRLVWRWNKGRGAPASITVLSVTNEKPTQQFMDALRGWCQARGFEFPRDDVIPTTGGTKCAP